MTMSKNEYDNFIHEQVEVFEASIDKIYKDALAFHAKSCDSPDNEKEECAKAFMIIVYKTIHRHLASKAGMPLLTVTRLN